MSLSAEDVPPTRASGKPTQPTVAAAWVPIDHTGEIDEDEDDYDETEFDHEAEEHHSTSLRFLLAGGIAGAGSWMIRNITLMKAANGFILSSLAELHCSI